MTANKQSAELAQHVVRVEHDPESHACAPDCHDDCATTLICNGVTDACRTWWECAQCRAVLQRLGARAWVYDDRVDENGGRSHGREHERIDGMWMVPSNRCLSVTCDEDNARDLVTTLADGDHPVLIDWDEGFVYVSLPPASKPEEGQR